MNPVVMRQFAAVVKCMNEAEAEAVMVALQTIWEDSPLGHRLGLLNNGMPPDRKWGPKNLWYSWCLRRLARDAEQIAAAEAEEKALAVATGLDVELFGGGD